VSRRARIAALLALAVAALLAATFAATAGAATAAWTTYNHDLGRSGIDPDSTSPLPPAQAWRTSLPLDGQIYGQPLVYGSRVYVATENDTVYALDAATGQVVWHQHAGTPVPDVQNAGCGDIGNVGITGTPVIDPATNRIFAVADTWDGTNKASIHHRLVGFDATTGAPAVGLPLTVDPPGSEPAELLQRPGLALDAGRVVIGYGGNSGDCGNYHGWVVAAPESGAGSVLSFEVDPHSQRGAIWGSGNGLPVDAAGNVYAATGNGSGTTYDFQESVLKLDSSLNLVGNWAPTDWQSLDGTDADIGSSEPLLLPSGLLFQTGKQGLGYLVSSTSPGHGPAAPVFQGQACQNGGGFGGGIYSGGIIYAACSDGLRALSLNTTTRSFAPLSGFSAPKDAIGPPILAGGLVWSVAWRAGTLYGLNPTTGATAFSAKVGTFDHFASPGAGGGKLFVAAGDAVSAFTIATPPAGPPPPPPPGGHAAPVISHITVKARHGKLALTLSEAATVTVVISRRLPGRLAHHRCRAGVRHGKRCLRLVRKLKRTFTGTAGVDNFGLRLRKLRNGRYTAAIVAVDSAGAASTQHKVRFRLLRHTA
jgi:outer membrane protein assembly factor BamB